MTDCARFHDRLSDALDAEPGEPIRDEHDVHVASCPRCAALHQNALHTKEVAQGVFGHSDDTLPTLPEVHVRSLVDAIQRGVSEGPESAAQPKAIDPVGEPVGEIEVRAEAGSPAVTGIARSSSPEARGEAS